ncbi:hypothetical protein ANABIO32_00370 [Rossellomorea marisflavi]|uniref:hypothetical protein n=1 Tax=Rossellomorea marisflavi TaxID=189381 RepID=UPI0025C7989B|nr:hypothetical protein [Rossellomorea marisflavi]GLI82351.1 hypothetical protein ANABIO32_00370 [Rossellomorea marisflavi]
MTIKLDIHTWTIDHSGTHEGYKYDQLKINNSSGKRLYLTAINKGMRMVTVSKLMKFEEGKVLLSFGKNKIEIGTYQEVLA